MIAALARRFAGRADAVLLPPPAIPKAPPMDEGRPSEHDAIACVARAICEFYRQGPCPCRADPDRVCNAMAIWRRKAGAYVMALRWGGFLK